jgi:hypothetical protein
MPKVTLYTPLCEDSNGVFTVDGSQNKDQIEAERIAMMHSSFTDQDARIYGWDKLEVWE